MQTPAQKANLIAVQKAMMADPSFPEPFAIWGFLMGVYRRSLLSWLPTDARLFLAPYLTLSLVFVVFSDFDNLVASFLFRASPVILVLYLASSRKDTTR